MYVAAIKKKLESVSIPPISGGIFGYPIELCALDIISELFRIAKITRGTLKLIRIVIIDSPTFKVFFKQFINSRREYFKKGKSDPKVYDSSQSSKNSSSRSQSDSPRGENMK